MSIFKKAGSSIILVAFLILGTGVFLYLYQGTGSKLPFQSPYSAVAEFKDIDNIVQASRVQVAGVQVGVVDDVQREGRTMRVRFSINDNKGAPVPLHQGATV